jgi:hypothetical protein
LTVVVDVIVVVVVVVVEVVVVDIVIGADELTIFATAFLSFTFAHIKFLKKFNMGQY